MSTLLVTIDGPADTVDLALSGETPIAELMPTVLEMAVPTADDGHSSRWSTAPGDGQSLPTEGTLSECGVTDRAVLVLRRAEGSATPRPGRILTADQLVLISDREPATATLVTQASKLLLRSGVPLTVVVNKLSTRAAPTRRRGARAAAAEGEWDVRGRVQPSSRRPRGGRHLLLGASRRALGGHGSRAGQHAARPVATAGTDAARRPRSMSRLRGLAEGPVGDRPA